MGTTLIAVGCGAVALAVGFVIGVLTTRQAVQDCETKLDVFLTHWVDSGLGKGPPDLRE